MAARHGGRLWKHVQAHAGLSSFCCSSFMVAGIPSLLSALQLLGGTSCRYTPLAQSSFQTCSGDAPSVHGGGNPSPVPTADASCQHNDPAVRSADSGTGTAASRHTESVIARPARRQVVAAAISGGVDSAVAAKRLLDDGHEVFGVFMRNWDETEELGNQNCSVERDFQDARRVCKQLGISLQEVDFVARYWQQVFQPFLDRYSKGMTPNPDLACNRAIKFDALLQHALGQGADALATGHYARLAPGAGGSARLLAGVDPLKDQSYFLAAVPGVALARCLFPLGSATKEDVRREAFAARLPPAAKRSSAGICFIGRRSFGDFIEQYVAPVPGRYVNIEGPESTAVCDNILAVTHGQRAGWGGQLRKSYVVGKDMASRTVFVAPGGQHPALYCREALLEAPKWVGGTPPPGLLQEQQVRVEFKARYGQPQYKCTLQLACSVRDPFKASSYSRYQSVAGTASTSEWLRVSFDDPVRAVTPGQELAVYRGEECLGSAVVAAPGSSLAELGEQLPLGWHQSDSVHMDALRQYRDGGSNVTRAYGA
mmetsp:Transcript_18002/g.54183  ORF Transcript_18002/g.54183 Transcript_18002/m.54183 type:complete len:541 (+) Transcript_18002:574-2196(+)